MANRREGSTVISMGSAKPEPNQMQPGKSWHPDGKNFEPGCEGQSVSAQGVESKWRTAVGARTIFKR